VEAERLGSMIEVYGVIVGIQSCTAVAIRTHIDGKQLDGFIDDDSLFVSILVVVVVVVPIIMLKFIKGCRGINDSGSGGSCCCYY